MTVRDQALRLFLDRIGARSRLSAEQREAILALPGEATTIAANTDLVRLGEVVDRTCLVAEGLMARFGQTLAGDRQISAFYIPGDMPDLHSFVLPRSHWALTALARTTVVRVPHAAIGALIERHPGLARAFWRDCTLDSAITAEWILNIGRRDARARLAHLLCEMAARYERIGAHDGACFPLPASQSHLAEALGLTPVHVNRTLAKLKEAGVARIAGRVVHVLNRAGLEAISEFDPTYLQFGDAND